MFENSTYVKLIKAYKYIKIRYRWFSSITMSFVSNLYTEKIIRRNANEGDVIEIFDVTFQMLKWTGQQFIIWVPENKISGRVITWFLFTITLCHKKWYLLFFRLIFQNFINMYRSCSRKTKSDSSCIRYKTFKYFTYIFLFMLAQIGDIFYNKIYHIKKLV